jgi:hypothetical protein
VVSIDNEQFFLDMLERTRSQLRCEKDNMHYREPAVVRAVLMYVMDLSWRVIRIRPDFLRVRTFMAMCRHDLAYL